MTVSAGSFGEDDARREMVSPQCGGSVARMHTPKRHLTAHGTAPA
jgi:hypothetical protein